MLIRRRPARWLRQESLLPPSLPTWAWFLGPTGGNWLLRVVLCPLHTWLNCACPTKQMHKCKNGKRGCWKQEKVSWLPLFPDPWGGDTAALLSCCYSLRLFWPPQLPCQDGITPSTMRQNKSSHWKEETAQDTQLHVVLHPVGCTVGLHFLSVLLAKTLDCILLHFSSSSCVPMPQRGGKGDADTNFSHQSSQGDLWITALSAATRAVDWSESRVSRDTVSLTPQTAFCWRRSLSGELES